MVRSQANIVPELMDQPALPLADTHRALDDLDRVNRWLVGHHALKQSILPRLESSRAKQSLLDLGTGTGQVPTAAAQIAARKGLDLQILGVDRKLSHLVYGRELGILQLRVVADAQALPFRDGSVDWTTSNLFFHHFGSEQNQQILAEMRRVATSGALVVDLRRSLLARLFIRFFLRVLRVAHVAAWDGRASVANAWSMREVQQLLGAEPPLELRRRFPFRFSLVLPPTSTP